VELVPKLFGELRERYLERPGGYTRVLRIESPKEDQAPSAILELVDGPKDMRFAMTAKTLVRERAAEGGIRDATASNIAKITKFRQDGQAELEKAVKKLEGLERDEARRESALTKLRVYPQKLGQR
jgi:large subunit ribosomal protein L17